MAMMSHHSCGECRVYILAKVVKMPRFLKWIRERRNSMVAAIRRVFRNDNVNPRDKEEDSERFEIKGYKVGGLLAEGGNGIVYSGVRIKDGMNVAIKRIEKDCVTRWQVLNGRRVPTEIYLMYEVAHIEGCVKIFDYFERNDEFVIVMERPEGSQDLLEYLNENVVVKEEVAGNVFGQIVKTLISCYAVRVLHGDIKIENILLDEKLRVKLIDFGGGSILRGTECEEFRGTLKIAPPEWIRSKYFFGKQATVWSLGIVLYEMVCGNELFEDHEEVLRGEVNFGKAKQRITEACQDLINQCLKQRPQERPQLEDILKHRWMKMTDLEKFYPSGVASSLSPPGKNSNDCRRRASIS